MNRENTNEHNSAGTVERDKDTEAMESATQDAQSSLLLIANHVTDVQSGLSTAFDNTVSTDSVNSLVSSLDGNVENSITNTVDSTVNNSLSNSIDAVVTSGVATSVESTLTSTIDSTITSNVNDTVSGSVEDTVTSSITAVLGQ